ncbi:MAG: 2-dehydropantoate 2-reductase N-terminal domain-containing protein, partial [Acidimicrobiales bacterium]
MPDLRPAGEADLAPAVVVIGPGAIGGAIAAALTDAGNQPLICARSRFTELTVDHPAGCSSSAVRCVTSPAELVDDGAVPWRSGDGAADVVVVAVKAHQTDGARDWLEALVGSETTVVVAQNGVEQVERVRPLVSPEADVVPAVVWCPAERSAPGRIEVTGRAALVVPDHPGGRRLADLLVGSFFEVLLSNDFAARAWDKLLINAALG